MNEYKLDNESVIKYKNSLTEAEYITLIEVAIDAYQNGIGESKDNLGIVPYNPIKVEQAFNRVLLSLCVKDYDEDEYDLYFSNGVHNVLVANVTNASDAWEMVQEIVTNSLSLSVVINNFMEKVITMLDGKLPEGKDLLKVLKKFPKDITKALNDYASIIEPTKAEFETKLANGDYKDIEKKEQK